jgi:glycine/D-amino acid oxidase-like deaminating enzyme
VATKRKDLRSGRPVWQDRPAPRVALARLSPDITTDVLVMGAGITGAVIADALAPTRIKVAVVDKRGPARGSTAASTALVQYEIDTPLITLTRRIGKENAVRAWRRSRLAVEALAARLGELRVTDVARRDPSILRAMFLDPKSSSRRTKRAIVGRPDVDADLYHFPAHERVRGTAPERR